MRSQPFERLIEITKEKGVAIDVIKVWHPSDLPQLELRRGFGVARPVPRHWHEEYQFCLVQSGASELEYRGTNYPTPPASLFMVHPRLTSAIQIVLMRSLVVAIERCLSMLN